VIVFANGTWSDPVNIDPGHALTSVSCPTTMFCLAVDNHGDAFTFTGSVTDWLQSVLDPNQDTIASVSCPSPAFCAAVDQSGDVYTYDGASWNPAGDIDSGNGFVQVSCFSRAFCAAIDGQGHAAVLTGGNWSVSGMPQTAASISCPAMGYCIAVDTRGEALVYRQGVWSTVSKIDGNKAFTAISCVKVNTCMAADRYNNVLYHAPSRAG